MPEDISKKLFDYFGGSILFLLGISIEIKNFFFTQPVNGYEIVFGLEFITAGVLLVYGKFKGFKEIKSEDN